MTTVAPTVRVRDFVGALFEGVDGFADVRTLPPIEEAFFPVTDVEAIEAHLKPRRDRNCYLGVAARRDNRDGSLKGCGSLTSLFADLDFKNFKVDDPEAEARARLGRFLRPSIVVASGGGLHSYWLLREPIDLQRDPDGAKTMLRRLARGLGADMVSAEPARILRLPNTQNTKYSPPLTVRVEVFEPDRRYNLSDFDDFLPAEPEEARILPGPTPDAIPEGQRESVLMQMAGAMRRKGMDADSIFAALRVVNGNRCRPPLQERDLLRMAKSTSRYVPGDPAEPTTFATPLPELLERSASITEPRWLIDGLIPGDGSVLLHSQPREYKTLAAQALLLAATTGTPAFGLERLQVAEPVPALYVTEEDGWWRVANRFGELLRGYGLDQSPDLLHISAGRGLNLDTSEWQERMIATSREQGYKLVVWDPLRSLTDTADQGPRELKPFALFMRRFIRETGAVVLIVHHDTKPLANTNDNRRRPQRASGGGVFSIADSPIGVDRIDETRRMLVPCAFKFAADPPAVTVRLEHGPGWLRLAGEETTAVKADDSALDCRILDFLKHSPYTYGNAVAKGARANKELVLQRLKALSSSGLVDSVEEGKGIKWFQRRSS